MIFGFRKPLFRRAALSLVALALTVLVLVPGGFMIAGGGSGRPISIVICTTHGPVTTVADLGKGTSHKDGKTSQICAFAAHGAMASQIPLSTKLAVVRPVRLTAYLPQTSQVAIGRGLAAPPPARGPPLSV